MIVIISLKYLPLSNLYKARAMPVKTAIMIDKNRRMILSYVNDMHIYFGNGDKSAAAQGWTRIRGNGMTTFGKWHDNIREMV
jgi:hypothetical protein